MRLLREDWEFNVLGVDNYRRPVRLRHYYRHIIEKHDTLEGDICEVGVYRGASLLGTAMLLKELGSTKRVWGYDTFAGFPPVQHENDRLEVFTELAASGRISAEQLARVNLHREYLRFLGRPESPSELSSSKDFADTSLEEVQQKVSFLGLDNVVLVPGAFADTMKRPGPDCTMAGLVDCDLYLSYRVALPFLWKRLSEGGYLFLDEYWSLKFPGARLAVDEFFEDKTECPKMHRPRPGEFERWYVKKAPTLVSSPP